MSAQTIPPRSTIEDLVECRAVAIIGVACRVPGASSPEELWQNIISGTCSIRTVSQAELELAGVSAEVFRGPSYVPRGAFIERPIGAFDAELFSYSAAEAKALDPQQRHFLECAWAAFEDAGYDPSRVAARVGVFAGCLTSTYLLNQTDPIRLINDPGTGFLQLISNDKDSLATRVGFKLNLRGPCISVQTFCSTSLVATHLAVQSIKTGDCDMAIAGAAAIRVPHVTGYTHHQGSIQAPDGVCRPFDSRASGTVMGNGVVTLLLKRFEAAFADGDPIYAVIRGSAVNNDGGNKAGYTAPSPTGQAAVITGALKDARLDASSIDLIEAHGTATLLGDQIEMEGLARVYTGRRDGRPYAMGALKANLGHLDCAAGAAGILKASLSLAHRMVPPVANFETPNPDLGFATRPFSIPREPQQLPANGPLRAGVSSFGIGGTNAHAILETAPQANYPRPERAHAHAELIILSAVTDSGLDRQLQAWGDRLLSDQAPRPLCDVAFTSQVGRKELPYRAAVVVTTPRDAGLRFASRSVIRGAASRRPPFLVFTFPGQGSQRTGAGLELWNEEPTFRAAMDRCAEAVRGCSGQDLRCLISSDEEVLGSPFAAHSTLFAVGYSTFVTLESWGIAPSALLGHSLGELTAACAAGVMTPEVALQFIYERSKLLHGREPGAMLAVSAAREELAEQLVPGTYFAAENSPRQCIASGTVTGISELAAKLESLGVTSLLVRTGCAYHTPLLADLEPQLATLIHRGALKKPRIPIFSGTTGSWMSERQATDPWYWASHVSLPVEFSTGVRVLSKNPGAYFVELGPAGYLTASVLQHVSNSPTSRGMNAISGTPSCSSERVALLETVAKLWTIGQRVNWAAFSANTDGKRTHLPTYQFSDTEYWFDKPLPTPAGSEMGCVSERRQVASLDHDAVVLYVTRQVESLTGHPLPATGLDTDFVELGLDSLLLTQMASNTKKQFGFDIKFRQFIEEIPTPRMLVSKIFECGQDELKESGRTDPVSKSREVAQAVAHGPFGPRHRGARRALSSSQRAFVERLTREYNARTRGSKNKAQESRSSLCDPRGAGGFRPEWKEMVYPIVCARSKGARLWDIDGNEYIDVTMGFGANYLGHSPGFVVDALQAQLVEGIEVGPQSPLAGTVARKLCDLTRHERVAFCNTGSEAIIAAMRVVRAASGREKIVVFSGSYHGIFDSVLVRGDVGEMGRSVPIASGIPGSSVDDTIVLPYVDERSIRYIEAHACDIAGVFVEPVQARHMDRLPHQFLNDLRSSTSMAGIPLVFDEIVTGFRCAPGGAQEYFGVRADLATYGKILGGGMPIGALAGTSELMGYLDGGAWSYGDESRPETPVTFFAGTFVRHPLALAASNSVLDFLAGQGGDLQKAVSCRVKSFAESLRDACRSADIPVDVHHFASLFNLVVPPTYEYFGLLYYLLRARGIHAWEGRLGHFSICHSDTDFSTVLSAYVDSLTLLKKEGFL